MREVKKRLGRRTGSHADLRSLRSNGLAGVLLAVGILAGSWLRSDERPKEAPAAKTVIVAPAKTAPLLEGSKGVEAAVGVEAVVQEAPVTAPAPAAGASPTDDAPGPVAVLKTALAEGDDLELVVAVEAAVEAHATDALPTLSSVDLARAPHSAPAVIQGIASLAKAAGPRERKEAAATLARWFRAERSREGLDAAGNTSVLIDALADTGHREAVDALVAALDEHSLPLHNETLVVQRLAELRQTSARAGIARFQARVAALPPTEGIDEELRHEAIAAAREALAQLGG